MASLLNTPLLAHIPTKQMSTNLRVPGRFFPPGWAKQPTPTEVGGKTLITSFWAGESRSVRRKTKALMGQIAEQHRKRP